MKKVYLHVYDREFTIEEIIIGLFGLWLPPDVRKMCVEETKRRHDEGKGDAWYLLNEENGGSLQKRVIPSRCEFWKIFDRGEDIEKYIPNSKGKRPKELNIQYALWGGCVDELDMYGFIIYFGYDEVLRVAKELEKKYPIEVIETESNVIGRKVKTIVIRYKG